MEIPHNSLHTRGPLFSVPLFREMSFSIRALHDFDVAATESADTQFARLGAQQKEREREGKRGKERERPKDSPPYSPDCMNFLTWSSGKKDDLLLKF